MNALADIVGPANVLRGDETDLYRWDALGPGRGFRGYEEVSPQPLCVVRPGSTEEVASIIRLAAEHRLPLVPFGSGSGLMGGAVAVRPSIVTDLTRMNHVVEIDGAGRTARAEAGIVLRDLDDRLSPEGLMLATTPGRCRLRRWAARSRPTRSVTGVRSTAPWATRYWP